MRAHEINDLAEKALHLYLITRDPLTLSAAKILLKVTSTPLNEPQENALQLIRRQVAAYEVLYTEPLV